MLTEISGVEEPPTDFTDAHRWLGCVGFSYGIHRIHSKLGCVRDCVGTAGCHTLLHLCKSVLSVGVPLLALLVQQRLLYHLGLHPCHLWETISRMWVRGYGRDAIPSYKTSVLICAICGRLFSARRFCAFRAFCGRTPFALLVQQRLLHPLSLHLWEAIS